MRRPYTKPSKYKWHTWFAWHPVTTVAGIWVWLEYTDRRKVHYYTGDEWEYTVYG